MQDIQTHPKIHLDRSQWNLGAVREYLRQYQIFQFDENDIPRLVITHEPEFAQTLGSLHPDGFLFGKAVDLKLAKQQHRNFRETINRHSGALVFTVRELLLMGCDDLRNRVQLEKLAADCIQYRLSPELSMEQLTPEEQHSLTDAYKAESVKKMTEVQLVDIIMSQPTIIFEKPHPTLHFVGKKIELDPLTNLTFCRDQQITTGRGVVVGAMKMVQRKMELRVMRFIFDKMGIPVVGEIPRETGATLEGGDFLPGGEDLCFIGVGLRTNMAAIEHMLKNDLFGTRRVAVVEDKWDCHPDRLHLDTVFSLLDEKNCIISDDIIGKDSKIRRLVTEYTRTSDGTYTATAKEVEFSEYLIANGYHIIPIPARIQLPLGCNVLNIGKGKVICTHEEAARLIIADTSFTGSVLLIPFTEIVAMNGGVHCASFVCRYPPSATFDIVQSNTPSMSGTASAPTISLSPVTTPSASTAGEFVSPRPLQGTMMMSGVGHPLPRRPSSGSLSSQS